MGDIISKKTKRIAEKEIQVESGPEPEIPERKIEEAAKKADKQFRDDSDKKRTDSS